MLQQRDEAEIAQHGAARGSATRQKWLHTIHVRQGKHSKPARIWEQVGGSSSSSAGPALLCMASAARATVLVTCAWCPVASSPSQPPIHRLPGPIPSADAAPHAAAEAAAAAAAAGAPDAHAPHLPAAPAAQHAGEGWQLWASQGLAAARFPAACCPVTAPQHLQAAPTAEDAGQLLPTCRDRASLCVLPAGSLHASATAPITPMSLPHCLPAGNEPHANQPTERGGGGGSPACWRQGQCWRPRRQAEHSSEAHQGVLGLEGRCVDLTPALVDSFPSILFWLTLQKNGCGCAALARQDQAPGAAAMPQGTAWVLF